MATQAWPMAKARMISGPAMFGNILKSITLSDGQLVTLHVEWTYT
jgi:hypothetical protein